MCMHECLCARERKYSNYLYSLLCVLYIITVGNYTVEGKWVEMFFLKMNAICINYCNTVHKN